MPGERKRRALPWVTLLLLGCGGAALIAYSRTREPPIEVETVRVEKGEVREMISSAAAGEVKPARRVTVRAEIAGTVAQVKRHQGDRIAAQEVIVLFTSDEIEARSLQAQANVDAARVAVRTAEARRSTAKKTLERARKLRAGEAISEAELDRAETEFDGLEHAVEQALAAEKQALAAQRLAEVTKKRASVVAPFAGVLQAVFAETGVQLAPGAALFDLIDDSSVRIDVPVDESDIARVTVGQRVILGTEGRRGRPLTGAVSLIPPAVGRSSEAGSLGAPMLGDKERWIYIQVSPDEPKELRVGASVNAEFLVSARQDVLYVPSHVVIGRGVTRAVYRIDRGKVVKTPIQAGLTSWERTEVVSGLRAADEVISSLNAKGLEEGARVVVRQGQPPAADPEPGADVSTAAKGP